MRRTRIALLAALSLAGGLWAAQSARSAAAEPNVLGEWTGTWGDYTPPAPGQEAAPKKPSPYQARLDCKVVRKDDGKWQATFEGEAGRPYKYTIVMQGRQAGDAVLFQGTADLGEKDGGVYDWIGRANEKEFVGFYTSQRHTGAFRLGRK